MKSKSIAAILGALLFSGAAFATPPPTYIANCTVIQEGQPGKMLVNPPMKVQLKSGDSQEIYRTGSKVFKVEYTNVGPNALSLSVADDQTKQKSTAETMFKREIPPQVLLIDSALELTFWCFTN